MLGFNIDMNVGQFRKEYLEKWLKELAGLGYSMDVCLLFTGTTLC